MTGEALERLRCDRWESRYFLQAFMYTDDNERNTEGAVAYRTIYVKGPRCLPRAYSDLPYTSVQPPFGLPGTDLRCRKEHQLRLFNLARSPC